MYTKGELIESDPHGDWYELLDPEGDVIATLPESCFEALLSHLNR